MRRGRRETLPGARRAINNQINEKYFLPHARDLGGGGGDGIYARVHLRITPVLLSCVREGVERGEDRRLAGGFICRSVTWRNFVGKLRSASASVGI